MAVRVLSTIDQLPEPVCAFMHSLTEEQKLLLALKRELYDQDWRPMITDLRNRLAGRPHLVRLSTRISDDLTRIHQMQELETQFNVDLSEHIVVEETRPNGMGARA